MHFEWAAVLKVFMTGFNSRPGHVEGVFSACMMKQTAKFNRKPTDYWFKHSYISTTSM